ncbi:HAMP domain-containing sensor histidine kinase [Asanoa siamensis]|uniref:histidine kinase n=1 Tax=Asanoa siamensis TaxID=926357 RepID=A0ABQ4CIE8_9ACTN|nr:HAMP domain-containing sensor histidine kinase [Asanoa siamensis]GIF71059.1 two-component sensor histidine kinase [Asanoa siamensis]
MKDLLNRGLDLLPRPLDPVRSIKLKLALLLVASAAAGLAYFWYALGRIPYITSATALLVGLLTSQVLAHGMTSPLRDMTAAVRAMRRGDYTRRVRATSRDEVGELADAFNQMAADLAAADRQRRELIANVSHELRTPITALQGVLENIVDGVAEPEPATLRTALHQTERLTRLVAELLDLSRLDAGVQPMHPVRFDVADFLDEVADEAAVTAIGAGHDIKLTVTPPPSPVTLHADPARLHQVLANLLDNAARHSPPGGTVSVAGRLDDDRVVIEVGDEGPGIPPSQRETVFDRFTRGDRAAGGGTGLGLAIAQWVVQLHGGTIHVVDPPAGKGCLVRVSLPRLTSPAVPA